MRIYVIDVTGRVVNYDLALIKSIANNCNDEVKLFLTDTPRNERSSFVFRLRSLIPAKFKTTEHPIKRGVKAVETLLNYIYIVFIVGIKKPDILHFQWLPFLEVCSLEKPIVSLIRYLSPKTKLILTIHNIYPHGYKGAKKNDYKRRFVKISHYFDAFVTHTNTSKVEVISEFNLEKEQIYVIHHGVFEPNLSGIVSNEKHHETIRLISYGNQDYYKGTDLILDALSLLPIELRNNIELSIVGRVQTDYLELLRSKEKDLKIDWKPFYVEEKVLYQSIIDSDFILLPYRTITQSGVLLLALYFDKPLICSDLQPFKETLTGYPEEFFFNANDADSLKDVIINILNKRADLNKSITAIRRLRQEYSWEMAGKKTLAAYNSALNHNNKN